MTVKLSYPQPSDYLPRESAFDTAKWVAALRELKTRQNKGIPYDVAFGIVTKGWGSKEIKAFQSWVRYYDEQVHMKYKTANLYGYDGYYLPTVPSPVPAPPAAAPSLALEHPAPDVNHAEQRKKELELHRKKIIGRLQAARKLLTDEKGKAVAGDVWSKLLDALNDLEKQFHVVKVTASPRIYEDLIIRQANIFARSGSEDGSNFLMKLAQGLPGATPPADPNASVPNGGALPNAMPEAPGEEAPSGIVQFLNGINAHDPFDTHDALDLESDFDDEEDSEGDEVEIEEESNDSDDFLVVEAQAAPVPPPPPAPPAPAAAPPAPAPAAPEPDLEVTDGEKPQPKAESSVPQERDFDSLIDAAFSNLKVSDIVKRLDDLSRIFKNREIARQLSIVDMMMDKLGLSSFFPSLAEATRSALESNQYCLTRIDEVKSRLGGALDPGGKSLHDMGQSHSIRNQQDKSDLMGTDESPADPALDQVKQNLENSQKKEKLRKELRKNLEDNALLEQGNKQKAEVEGLTEDLANTQVQPAATPATPPPPAVK